MGGGFKHFNHMFIPSWKKGFIFTSIFSCWSHQVAEDVLKSDTNWEDVEKKRWNHQVKVEHGRTDGMLDVFLPETNIAIHRPNYPPEI